MRVLPLVLLAACTATPESKPAKPPPKHPGPPRTYVCKRAKVPVRIDGRLDEWSGVPSTEEFVDIEGTDGHPRPRFSTTAQMMWDDDHFYFAFVMEEPHLQASFRKRDSFIYQQDNDIEIFIDPNGDTHNYFELELNAFGTEWDLFLPKPYHEGGRGLHGFDFAGLKTAVQLDGTINDARDRDRGWTVEVAIPFRSFSEYGGRPKPGHKWRVNFSRVQWKFKWENGRYVKAHKKEDNWVWSPQGRIAMHHPEFWGIVEFAP